MVSVVIIAFNYESEKLISCLYDVYRIYIKYHNLGYNCYILTDFNNFTFNKDIYNTVYINRASKELLTFMEKLRARPSWYLYTTDFESIKDNINKIPVEDIAIVYYTGHGHVRGLQLPDGDILKYIGFKNLVTRLATKKMTIIMDCCFSSNLDLNFQLITDETDIYYKYLELSNSWKLPEITLITSCDINEKSIANKYNSLFTIYFLEFLDRNERRSFPAMINFVKYNIGGHVKFSQNIKIYSSCCSIPIMPSYLFTNMDIDLNYQGNFITFNKC